MSRATAKKLAVSSTAPNVRGTWDLQVTLDQNPDLALRLRRIVITGQVGDATSDLIFGSVKTSEPVTAYALEDGEVGGNSMTFTVTIDDVDYAFAGAIVVINGRKCVEEGTITPTALRGIIESEEGSWSAQAQG